MPGADGLQPGSAVPVIGLRAGALAAALLTGVRHTPNSVILIADSDHSTPGTGYFRSQMALTYPLRALREA